MLVLSRQRDETIMIGDDIEITVVDIRGDKVRLGITAPTRIAVHRKEVYEAIKKENEQAARLVGNELTGVRPGVQPGPARIASRAKASILSSGHTPPPRGGVSGPSVPQPPPNQSFPTDSATGASARARGLRLGNA